MVFLILDSSGFPGYGIALILVGVVIIIIIVNISFLIIWYRNTQGKSLLMCTVKLVLSTVHCESCVINARCTCAQWLNQYIVSLSVCVSVFCQSVDYQMDMPVDFTLRSKGSISTSLFIKHFHSRVIASAPCTSPFMVGINCTYLWLDYLEGALYYSDYRHSLLAQGCNSFIIKYEPNN